MTELRRWSEEGATSDEIALLEASRRERPSARAQARALRALGVAVGATTIGTTAPVAAAAATKGGLTFLSKIVILSLVGGGVVAGGATVRAVRHATQAPPRPAVVAVAKPVSPAPARTEESTAMSASTLASPPSSASIEVPRVHAGAPPRLPRPVSSNDPLARELKALELAHRALAAHDPRSALALLDRYRAQFPGGSLSSEATVLRAQALLESGDRAGAQAVADAYVSAHPDSPYAKRLKETVRGE